MTRADSVRSTYDAVAPKYADAMVNELDARPIERALLAEVVTCAGQVGGPIADVGCGPGHVTRFIADRGAEAFGLDLSPAMIDVARARFPGVAFRVGSAVALEDADASWAGAVALYSIIHMTGDERKQACREIARVLRPGAAFLVSFHVSTAEHPIGSSIHLDSWFETPVDLTGFFLDPEIVTADLRAAGFEIRARLDREPLVANEFQSNRCYLLARVPKHSIHQ